MGRRKLSVKGPATWFTGAVRIDSGFQAEEEGRSGGAIVTFEPGARTNWHTHPAGQTLVVLNGVGWTQCERRPAHRDPRRRRRVVPVSEAPLARRIVDDRDVPLGHYGDDRRQ
jgi:trehalose utilization protein